VACDIADAIILCWSIGVRVRGGLVLGLALVLVLDDVLDDALGDVLVKLVGWLGLSRLLCWCGLEAAELVVQVVRALCDLLAQTGDELSVLVELIYKGLGR
jgi:hypothetical protein